MCDANPRAEARLNGCSGGSSQGNGDVEDGDDTEALAHARAALLALRPTDFGVCIDHACALLACIEHFVSCLRAGGTDVTLPLGVHSLLPRQRHKTRCAT